MNNIQCWGNVAAIGAFVITASGAIVGIWGYTRHLFDFRRKRKRLEKYLLEEKGKGDTGQRSLLHIVRYVGLTQDETIKISFKSPRINRKLKKGEAGFADKLLFEYVGDEGKS